MATEDPQYRSDGGPSPGDDTVITARLAVYPRGYARFTDSAYDAIGVDRSVVDAVTIWTDDDRIALGLHATTDTDGAREFDAVSEGVVPANAVDKQSDGQFPFDHVLRELFCVDASVLETSSYVTVTWDATAALWKCSTATLADALGIEASGGVA